MKNFYLYKITFESGKTYIGMHKQKKENDNYITSSTYFRKHPEDRIFKREILYSSNDEYIISFLETYCILSDKAYQNEKNVNYNFGNFFHRFSTQFISKEDRLKSIEKQKNTWKNKSKEEKEKIIKKQQKTMNLKSKEEKEDIRKRISESLKNKLKNIPEDQRILWNKKISKGRKKYFENMSVNEKIEFGNKVSKGRKEAYKNYSEERKQKIAKAQIEPSKKWWKNATLEEKKNKYKGFLKVAEKRKKKVRNIETGKIFDSLQDVQKWLGPKTKGCNISAQINKKPKYSYAYKHPETGEKLHWEFVD